MTEPPLYQGQGIVEAIVGEYSVWLHCDDVPVSIDSRGRVFQVAIQIGGKEDAEAEIGREGETTDHVAILPQVASWAERIG